MICSKCGTPNDDNAKFCSSCGSPLSAPVQQQPAAPPMAPPPVATPGQAPSPPPMAPPPGQVSYAPAPQAKPYKAEFTMGLIGSIVGIIIWLVMLITGISAATVSYGFGYYGYGYGFGAGAIVGSFFVLAAFILGFIGTSQVNKGKGKGGILLTIGGGLGFISMFMGIWIGWTTIFFYPLLLAAGIMALARRKKVESGIY